MKPVEVVVITQYFVKGNIRVKHFNESLLVTAVIIIVSKLYFMGAITTVLIIMGINFVTLIVIVIKFIVDKQLLAELTTILGSYLEFIQEHIVVEQDTNKFI